MYNGARTVRPVEVDPQELPDGRRSASMKLKRNGVGKPVDMDVLLAKRDDIDVPVYEIELTSRDGSSRGKTHRAIPTDFDQTLAMFSKEQIYRDFIYGWILKVRNKESSGAGVEEIRAAAEHYVCTRGSSDPNDELFTKFISLMRDKDAKNTFLEQVYNDHQDEIEL